MFCRYRQVNALCTVTPSHRHRHRNVFAWFSHVFSHNLFTLNICLLFDCLFTRNKAFGLSLSLWSLGTTPLWLYSFRIYISACNLRTGIEIKTKTTMRLLFCKQSVSGEHFGNCISEWRHSSQHHVRSRSHAFASKQEVHSTKSNVNARAIHCAFVANASRLSALVPVCVCVLVNDQAIFLREKNCKHFRSSVVY